MIERAVDWLPGEAFSDDAVKAALSGLVAGWSERWFARRTAGISAVRRKDGQPPAPAAQCTYIKGAAAAAELPGLGKRRLLEAALDIDLSGQTLAEADHHLLDAFAACIMDDLVARFDEALGGEDDGAGTTHIHVKLSIAENDVLSIVLPSHKLVPMLKSRLVPARKPNAAPQSRIEALKPTRLVAQGLLGRAELAVNDLKGLAVGDVLILDRSLNEPVELRLADGGRQIGRGKLVRNGAQISIQF